MVFRGTGPDGIPVAGKRFNLTDNTFIPSAEREIKLLKKLRHPNVVKIYDTRRDERGFLWMIMELCQMNCERYLEQNDPPIQVRLELVVQCIEAIMFIHSKDIVHRDIKLRNTLITFDNGAPIVKVCDFGLSKELESTQHMASNVGTEIYKAPEVKRGPAERYDKRVDSFSLGLMSLDIILCSRSRPPGSFPEISGDTSKPVGDRLTSTRECQFVMGNLSSTPAHPVKDLIGFIITKMIRYDPNDRCTLLEYKEKVISTLGRLGEDTRSYRQVDPSISRDSSLETRPWRPDQTFDEETYKEILKKVREFKSKIPNVVQKPKILFIGPVGAGKSSYVVSVDKVFNGRDAQIARVEESESTSCTRTYSEYIINEKDDDILNFTLCDSMGIEVKEDAILNLKEEDFEDILTGRLKQGTRLDEQLPVRTKSERLRAVTKEDDKISLVVFVVNAEKVTLPEYQPVYHMMRQLKTKHADKHGIRCVVLLTKVDVVCEVTQADISKMFESETVNELAYAASNPLGIQIHDVLPVVNYGLHDSLKINMNIQILRCLVRMLSLVNTTLLEKSSDLIHFDNAERLDKPFAQITFTKERREQLAKDVMDFTMGKGCTLLPRVQLIGEIQAGKTSVVCSIDSEMTNTISNIAQTGKEDTSITKQFCIHEFYDVSGNKLPLRIGDSMGLEVGSYKGLHGDDVKALINGNIMKEYAFNPLSGISSRAYEFLQDPGPNDKVHCLVIIIDGEKWSSMHEDMKKKLKAAIDYSKLQGTRCMLIITKIDLLDPLIHESVRNAPVSRILQKTISELSERFGIQKANIFFLKNYESELETEMAKSILVLMSIKRMQELSKDCYREQGSRSRPILEAQRQQYMQHRAYGRRHPAQYQENFGSNITPRPHQGDMQMYQHVMGNTQANMTAMQDQFKNIDIYPSENMYVPQQERLSNNQMNPFDHMSKSAHHLMNPASQQHMMNLDNKSLPYHNQVMNSPDQIMVSQNPMNLQTYTMPSQHNIELHNQMTTSDYQMYAQSQPPVSVNQMNPQNQMITSQMNHISYPQTQTTTAYMLDPHQQMQSQSSPIEIQQQVHIPQISERGNETPMPLNPSIPAQHGLGGHQNQIPNSQHQIEGLPDHIQWPPSESYASMSSVSGIQCQTPQNNIQYEAVRENYMGSAYNSFTTSSDNCSQDNVYYSSEQINQSSYNTSNPPGQSNDGSEAFLTNAYHCVSEDNNSMNQTMTY